MDGAARTFSNANAQNTVWTAPNQRGTSRHRDRGITGKAYTGSLNLTVVRRETITFKTFTSTSIASIAT